METTPGSAQATLIFIPDISGFTQFVTETEIKHSQHIIEELLEAIIDANEIGLEVSEIEGDAVLFYRTGKSPTVAELLAQVQRIYVQFHSILRKYDKLRICQCGACSTASKLSLKFVIHYGDLSEKQVKSYRKLFGPSVIVAHRLLKNSVNHQEYALFSMPLINACTNWVDIEQATWSPVEHGQETYDSGPVKYCYISLAPLREQIPEPTKQDFGLRGDTLNLFSLESIINAPIDLVFDVVSDHSYRAEWVHGLKGVGELNSKIARIGSQHRCIINENQKDPLVVNHEVKVERNLITMLESDLVNKFDAVIQMYRVSPVITRMEYTGVIKKSRVARVMFNLFMKKKTMRDFTQTFSNLKRICERLHHEKQNHSNRIVLNMPQ